MGNAPFKIFLSVLIFSPIAFGTVEQWSLSIMESASFLALLTLMLVMHNRKETFYSVPGTLPLLLLLSYMLMQILPLPAGIIKIVSPKTYALYEATVGVVEPLGWLSISINRKAALLEFFRLASYGAFYILTVQLLTKKDLLKRTTTLVVVFGSVLAFIALLQFILASDKIFLIRKVPENAHPFGPYLNRNHYAGLMGMVFPLVIGLLIYALPAVRYASFREKISSILGEEKTSVHFLAFSTVLITTTVFLSRSRSGILCLVMSLIFYFWLINKTTGEKRFALIPIFLFAFLSVGWFGWDPILERFGRALAAQPVLSHLRPAIWKDSLQIIKDFPITGTGPGSFSSIYPAYRTLSGTDKTLLHAHNDYIELFAEGGIIAFLLAGWFLISVFRSSYLSFLKRRDLYSIYLAAGGFAGILSLMLHSITDFNLHTGANGLYFSFLLGLTVSASNTRLRVMRDDTYLKKAALPSKPLMASAAVVSLACLSFNAFVLTGEYYFSRLNNIKSRSAASVADLIFIKETAEKASRFDPLEAGYHYSAGNAQSVLNNKTASSERLGKSVKLNPSNAEYIQRLGFVLTEERRYEEAGKLLHAGIRYDISNPVRYEKYASWLLARGERERGMGIIKKAMDLRPSETRRLIATMVLYNLSDNEIQSALPGRVLPHLLFADYLHKTGEEEKAKAAYLDALKYIENEKTINASFFYIPHNHFLRLGLYDDALKIMVRAMEFLPEDAGIRRAAAESYERLGITYRAMEEYEKALLLNPSDTSSRERLEALKQSKSLH
jgi:O-antigen ligase/Tfp pilus assembly protein PilF